MKQNHLRNYCYFAAVLVIIFACCLSSCSKKDDIALILSLVEKAEAHAEEHDTGKLMEFTSKNFTAQDGKLKRQEVRKFLWLIFRRYGKFNLLFPEPAVEISDKEQSATVVVHFLIVKKEQPLPDLEKLYKDPERWLEEVGELADLYRLNLQFLKIDDKWQVTAAKIEPYRGFGFRVRKKITSHFRISSSGHLWPILNRELLEIACYSCGFTHSDRPKLT